MRELLPAIHDPNVKLEPGRPGRGYDPTAGFADLQWYLYHNRDIAYFAAFSSRDYSEKAALEAARMLAGATLPGVNGGVAVSGRDLVTLNFAMEKAPPPQPLPPRPPPVTSRSASVHPSGCCVAAAPQVKLTDPVSCC